MTLLLHHNTSCAAGIFIFNMDYPSMWGMVDSIGLIVLDFIPPFFEQRLGGLLSLSKKYAHQVDQKFAGLGYPSVANSVTCDT